MPTHVRLVHKLLGDGFHVFTSPDVKGLHASAETIAEAQWQAMDILDFLSRRDGVPRPHVTFEERPDLRAAE